MNFAIKNEIDFVDGAPTRKYIITFHMTGELGTNPFWCIAQSTKAALEILKRSCPVAIDSVKSVKESC